MNGDVSYICYYFDHCTFGGYMIHHRNLLHSYGLDSPTRSMIYLVKKTIIHSYVEFKDRSPMNQPCRMVFDVDKVLDIIWVQYMGYTSNQLDIETLGVSQNMGC